MLEEVFLKVLWYRVMVKEFLLFRMLRFGATIEFETRSLWNLKVLFVTYFAKTTFEQVQRRVVLIGFDVLAVVFHFELH